MRKKITTKPYQNIHIRMPLALHRRVTDAAVARGVSMHSELISCLEAGLQCGRDDRDHHLKVRALLDAAADLTASEQHVAE
jgi:hypothetical protein